MATDMSRALTRNVLRLCAGGLMLASFLVLAASPAHATIPTAPSWSIYGISYPTNFGESENGTLTRGPGYFLVATNTGGEATGGAYSLTDTLPAGLTPGLGISGRDQRNHRLTCSSAGQEVTCTGSEPINPGEYIKVTVPVKVGTGLPAAVTDEAVVGGGGSPLPATTTFQTAITTAIPRFGFLPGANGFATALLDGEGEAAREAGSHPYQLDVGMNFPTERPRFALRAAGYLHEAAVTLPRGVVANPTATTVRCKEAQLEETGCPDASQIGTVSVSSVANLGPFFVTTPLYNMVPPPGSPSSFGFNALNLNIFVHLLGHVEADGDYELSASASDVLALEVHPILGVQVHLWGSPSDPSHDAQRGECTVKLGGCSRSVEPDDTSLLTMPSACSGPLVTQAHADSWEEPGVFDSRTAESTTRAGEPVGVEGCERLAFRPTLTLTPEVRKADTPTGLHVDLHVPQTTGLENVATANLKDAKVTLPPGLVVNPSAANGLAACSEAQFGQHSDEPSTCPDASKIGTVEVDTPLLDHPLPGAVYIAKPYENPFGSLLAIYIAVHDPETGVVIKLAGHVEANEQTGQLTTTFDENPELPFEDFKLEFFGGPRAALRTPATCGSFSYSSELTPWSGTAAVAGDGAFPVDEGANGGACAASEAVASNAPAFEAGTTNPLAGSYGPFVLHLKREDGSQVFRSLTMSLPPGLVGKLAGVPYCPDPALAAAAGRSGAEEKVSPSCPAASEVGKVTVGAGAGPLPYYVTGTAYLAGPYKGAPLSLAIITPAVAGPYDLGTVVVRSALEVDQRTAQITVESDPIPTILKGIPLDIRSIAVELNRQEFTRNPTNCEAMAITGQETSAAGGAAALSNGFQVGGCAGLAFKPQLKLQLKGATTRTGHPALKAVVTFPKRGAYANIARAQVNLPHGEFLDQGNLNRTCTKPVLLAGQCPASTVYGRARAWTPLLEHPLQGPVYLVGGYGYKLPALVAELNGQIRVLLVGKVDSGKNKGIRNTFEVVPDAPVSRFELSMKGGRKYGLLENSENLCKAKKAKRRAIVRFTGQNGKVDAFKPMVRNQCRKVKTTKKSGAHSRVR